jgi:superfamily I DNA/RNA helicase
MTRAKERLYLTLARKRRIFGKTVKTDLSPFIEDIKKRLRTHEASVLKKKKKYRHVQLELF